MLPETSALPSDGEQVDSFTDFNHLQCYDASRRPPEGVELQVLSKQGSGTLVSFGCQSEDNLAFWAVGWK